MSGAKRACGADLPSWQSNGFLAFCQQPMFLRAKIRNKDGKPHRYFSVVENRRVGRGRTAQRTVLYPGEIDDSQQESWRQTLSVVLLPTPTAPAHSRHKRKDLWGLIRTNLASFKAVSQTRMQVGRPLVSVDNPYAGFWPWDRSPRGRYRSHRCAPARRAFAR